MEPDCQILPLISQVQLNLPTGTALRSQKTAVMTLSVVMQVLLAADVIYDADLTASFLDCACNLLAQVALPDDPQNSA